MNFPDIFNLFFLVSEKKISYTREPLKDEWIYSFIDTIYTVCIIRYM